MKVIPLSEGSFTIDKTKVFVPFDPEEDELKERSVGSLLVEVQPFAVITFRDVLLLDTGLGFEIGGMLQIHRNLLDNGIQPSSVTKILLSHLHKDHAGGVSVKSKLGHYSLSFPEAKYYVSAKELDYGFETGFPSYLSDEFNILINNKQTVLLGEEGVIDDYITYETAGGHCPYHLVFWLRENGETIFFGGDVAPTLNQMRSRYVAKYDFDGRKSMELRQQWWQQGKEEHWTFLFYHDIKTPFYPNMPNIQP